MLSKLRLQNARRPSPSLANIRRWFATETPKVVPSTLEDTEENQRRRYEEFLADKEKIPPTRPQLNVSVSPSHGLYAFFRQVPVDAGLSTIYETVEAVENPGTKMGRSWNAMELRRKSFKDLHTLWYIVLRERNLIATQMAEARRLGVMEGHLDTVEKDTRCRKTMARIKQVLNERRLAYEQAHALLYARQKEARRAKKGPSVGPEQVEEVTPSTPSSSEVTTNGRKPRRARS